MTEAGEIYVKLNFSMFKLEFARAGRGDSFSDKGFATLYEMIKRESAEINEPYELNVVALDSTYSEYVTIEAFNKDNNTHFTSWHAISEVVELVIGTEGAICCF